MKASPESREPQSSESLKKDFNSEDLNPWQHTV